MGAPRAEPAETVTRASRDRRGIGVKKLVLAFLALCSATVAVFVQVRAQEPSVISASDAAQAKSDFNTTCAGCHGENAGGGDRAPALIDNPHLRTLDVAGIETIIKSGQRASSPATR